MNVRVSEEPNLASPLLGRDSKQSRFATNPRAKGGADSVKGRPAISVLSNVEVDNESVQQQQQALAKSIMEDNEQSIEV